MGMDETVDRELIKGILRTLAKKGVYLTTMRTQKLLYLIERQCVLDSGNRCLWLDYRFDRFGMYSPTLNSIIKSLDPKRDGLAVRGVTTERGDGREIDYVKRPGFEEKPLPEHVERAVSRVVHEWMYLKTPTLISRAKQTSPFIHAGVGEKLDWGLLAEERCDQHDELTDEAKTRLGLSKKEAQSGRCKKFDNPDEVMSYLFA